MGREASYRIGSYLLRFVKHRPRSYNEALVFDMGVIGFDGVAKGRLQAELRYLLKLANQTTTANDYAFAVPSLS